MGQGGLFVKRRVYDFLDCAILPHVRHGGDDRTWMSMRLREWLETNGKSPEWLAEKLGRDGSTVRRWLRGTRRPNNADIGQIEALTEGQVTASDILLRPSPKRRPGRPARSKACAA